VTAPGALRAAVFGVNDGLESNSSLVMGFAGSGAANTTIAFAGLAGLLAGAFSMAAVALFAVGATIGLLNGRGALRSGTRQLLIGGAAALLVFGIGHLVGASAGGTP
jgi:VIT1/CCC1 family predicted Fe2+/Mn2+ transporter